MHHPVRIAINDGKGFRLRNCSDLGVTLDDFLVADMVIADLALHYFMHECLMHESFIFVHENFRTG